MTELNPPEPSMEEILASIRRIISEDLASTAPGDPADGGQGAVDEEDILILTERAPAEPWVFDEATGADPPGPPPAADPQPERAPSLPVAAADERSIAVPTGDTGAAAAFERLYFVVDNPPPPAPVAVSSSGPTLEDLTRELLKPVIKAWLDENLDAIVRARVDEEIERISRSRVR